MGWVNGRHTVNGSVGATCNQAGHVGMTDRGAHEVKRAWVPTCAWGEVRKG